MIFVTKKELVEHIKCVGKQIIADADKMADLCYASKSISISATINPDDEATTLFYETEKYADPRIKSNEESSIISQ